MQNQPAAQDTAQDTTGDASKSGRVLPFRRPGKGPTRPHAGSLDDDFARYEEECEEPIDERQRMLTNLIGVGIVVLLISVGVWIADTIQMSVKAQDCALQGRTNCAPIEVPERR